MKNRVANIIILLIAIGSLCACNTSRTFKRTAPLSQPNYGGASIAKFEDANPLGHTYNERNDFIFKGRIDSIEEVNISWKQNAGNDTITLDQWISVCEITICNVLYGTSPGNKETVKIVFGQSTRLLDSSEFRLQKEHEYYFITHVFNQDDRTKEYDPIQIYEFGDAMGGTFYNLLPVADGIVMFRGWSFDGAEPPVSKDVNTVEGIAWTIKEDIFIEQFTSIIRDAKSKITLTPNTPVMITSSPIEKVTTSP